MNKNMLIVIAGGFLTALLVAMLVSASLEPAETEVVETKVEDQILVAVKDLKVGDTLKAEDVRWQNWPASAMFSGAIVRKPEQKLEDAAVGRVLRDIAKDEPVSKSALTANVEGNFIAAAMQPGERAVAIKVNAESMAGGFIIPGDYVDVIMTYDARVRPSDDPVSEYVVESNVSKLATETILQNVKVLAIDQNTKAEEEKIKVAKTITLAVGIDGAEKLALASEMGTLTLALRAAGDEIIDPNTRPATTDERMTRIYEEVRDEYVRTKQQSGGMQKGVNIYSGAQRQKVMTE